MNYQLRLKGYVGSADFDRDYVDYILAKHEGKPVNVLIDSLGGSVATALSIASAFRNHGNVSVHFVGMNASAATIASLGAKHISIDANAMYLVHKCSAAFFEWGSLNSDQFSELINDCEKIKEDLDKLDMNIASMYSARSIRDAKEILAVMQRGAWLTAAEAKEFGFVDEITDLPEEEAPKLTDAVASAMAAVGMPIPNIPVEDKQSAFARFLATFAALFTSAKKEKNINKETEMTEEEKTAETVAQDNRVQELEARISELEATIAERDMEIANIKEHQPAEDTNQVLNNGKTAETNVAFAQIYEDLADAKKILNEIR